jgi:hypothetical protein
MAENNDKPKGTDFIGGILLCLIICLVTLLDSCGGSI